MPGLTERQQDMTRAAARTEQDQTLVQENLA
jgi:hypothetical protein